MKKILWAAAALTLAACGGSSNDATSDREAVPDETYAGIETPLTHQRLMEQDSATGGAAKLRVHLTDAPNRDIEAAEVTIDEVSVHSAGGPPYSVLSEPRTLDLLEYQDGLTTLLGEIDLEAGKYTQIRLAVSEGRVVSEGEEFEVFVPSGKVRLNRPFELCADGETDLTVDFDAHESLRYNPGKNEFMMKPVVSIEQLETDCPETPDEEDEADEEDESQYDGPTGWLAIALPPVQTELFDSLVTTVDDVRVHDQGIGQVSVLSESYAVDLLEEERQLIDEDTGEAHQTILVPPTRVPAGQLDQVRLLFQPIIATDQEGRTILIELPHAEDSEADGLKFFDEVEICEDALTVLQWELNLDETWLDFESGESVVELHPIASQVNLTSTCEPVDTDEDEADEEGEDEDNDESEEDESDDGDDDEEDTEETAD